MSNVIWSDYLRGEHICLDPQEADYAEHVIGVLGYRTGISELPESLGDKGTLLLSKDDALNLMNGIQEIVVMDDRLATGLMERIRRALPTQIPESHRMEVRGKAQFFQGRSIFGSILFNSLQEYTESMSYHPDESIQRIRAMHKLEEYFESLPGTEATQVPAVENNNPAA